MTATTRSVGTRLADRAHRLLPLAATLWLGHSRMSGWEPLRADWSRAVDAVVPVRDQAPTRYPARP